MNVVESLFSLKGKTALITGGAGFLAGAFGEILAVAGAHIVLADVSEKLAFLTKRTLSIRGQIGVGARVNCDTFDVVSAWDVEKGIKRITRNTGEIDILVNNAAMNPVVGEALSQEQFSPLEDYPLDCWKKEIEVNLTGTFLCCKEVGKVMLKQGGGVIINISSIYGMVGPDQSIYKTGQFKSPAYSASKAAIINLTRHLAAYWKGKNIRVNTLTLGGVFNNQGEEFVEKYSAKTMMGRMAVLNEVKGPLLFLASSASSYMTGANLVVDGGWTAW